MKRGSFLYKFAKKCEKPNDKMPWKILHRIYMRFSIVYGAKVYNKIRKENSKSKIIYCYSVSMGDYYLFSLVIDEFLKYNKIDNYIFVIPDTLIKLCKAMKYRNLYPLGFMEFCTLNIFLNFDRGENIDSIQLCPWLLFEKINNFKKIPELHIQDSNFDSKKYNDLNLKENNTVILAPYEKSISWLGFPTLPESFWKLLAKRLNDLGYYVCTNCVNNASEPPVKDTIPVLPKYDEISKFCETCGYVVSVRSGFADMCTFSNCRKVFLYPNQQAFSMWSIKESLGVNQDICEIIYEDYLEKLELLVDYVVEVIQNDKRENKPS